MIYDLLFGLKKIQGGGTLKKLILEYHDAMNKVLNQLIAETDNNLIPKHLNDNIILPRYARINLLRISIENMMDQLVKDEWKLMDYSEFIHLIENHQDKTIVQEEKNFAVDKDFDDILLFPPNTDFHNYSPVIDGYLILQDKASYMSGKALSPPSDDNTYCIDACAAPGQKTSQLAQSMNNKGTLIAIDKDAKRLKTLRKITSRNGVKNLTAINKSFLDINPYTEPYSKVEYILLDPSCSGSGIVNRQDFFMEENNSFSQNEDRIKMLSEFQISMIKHAFKFPKLKKLVYSTCSIHEEENEIVVEEVLKDNKQFQLEKVFPEYESRGLSKYKCGEYCVRTSPHKDRTIGFFLCIFVRNPDFEEDKKDINIISQSDDLNETPNSNSDDNITNVISMEVGIESKNSTKKKKRKRGKVKPILSPTNVKRKKSQ